MLQELIQTVSVTADTTPGVIDLGGLDDGDIVALAVQHGYNADLEFSANEAGTHRITVPDDTASPDNYTFWYGPVLNAPIYAFAAASTSIDVMVFKVRG